MDCISECYKNFVQILKEELVPAMGCTEPIAIAYCAAKARKALGMLPDEIIIKVSGNIVKNVKSVVVPNTNGLKGIKAAAAIGIVAGNCDKVLEVLSDVNEAQKEETKKYLQTAKFTVLPSESDEVLDIVIEVRANGENAKVRICRSHTHIVLIEKNHEILFKSEGNEENIINQVNRSELTIKNIIEFADCVKIEDVKDILDNQIRCNTAISNEGLKNSYGANVGKVLLNYYGTDIKVRAKAVAAAGSDARMSGCEMPVIINSGSGNQGMTASLPVIEYAKELHVEPDLLYRALLVSNLTTIHLKTGIGKLSAYCGAVSAGAGAGAGIAYLLGGRFEEIAHTIVNALAITSGIVCDGAKPSCAGKIAASVEAGILGYYMYKDGQQFRDGEGIVCRGVENTIHNVSQLGSQGMKETDKEIIAMMLENA